MSAAYPRPASPADRQQVLDRLHELGYVADWQVLNASEFGVPQLRPRFILVAVTADAHEHFEWPRAIKTPPTVGEILRDHMAADGWRGADAWARKANGVGRDACGRLTQTRRTRSRPDPRPRGLASAARRRQGPSRCAAQAGRPLSITFRG